MVMQELSCEMGQSRTERRYLYNIDSKTVGKLHGAEGGASVKQVFKKTLDFLRPLSDEC